MQQQDVQNRRKARQKKARRKRLKICFVFFVLMALITLAIMCFTVFFPIKRISVSGSEIYSKAEIIKASGLTTDDNLFLISEEKTEQKIRESLPYVDSIKLKRNLPDALVLTVTDAKEYYCFKISEEYFVVSENGYVLSSTADIPENVFEIAVNGVKCEIGKAVKYENSTEEELVKTLITWLNEKEINIDKIDVSNILNITVDVENKFTVTLGNSEHLEKKIAHLSGMIDSIGDRSGTINLSMWTPDNSQGSFVEKVE